MPITIISLLKPYRAKLVLILTFIFISNLLALILPWVIKIFIDDILINKDTIQLHLIMSLLVASIFLRLIFSFLKTYMSSLVGEKIVQRLRQTIYEHLPQLSLISINRISPSQILTRITQDVESTRRFLFRDAIEFIYAFFNIGFIIIILAYLNIRLTGIALLTLPMFAGIYFHLLPELQNNHSQLREMYGALSSRMNEFLNGIRVVRSFARYTNEKKLFDQKQKDILHIAKKTHFLNSWVWVGIEFFTSLGVVGILWIGGSDVVANRMTAGELVAFYTYLGILFSPIIRMVIINTSYQEVLASIKRINEILRIDDEVSQPQFPISLSNSAGRIEFLKVNFQYRTQKPLLKDIHFIVEPGETIGIVGASGAGKTTLISLLLRFFDPDKGEIRIDGCNLNKLNLNVYRQQIAVVLQDDFLFSGSIEDNIKYGHLEASQQEVMEAAQIAQAHAFISALPQGYQTEIGERGFNLSNGQRQRLAIARAIIKNPAILVLDEATSSVDALTENDIQKSIHQYMLGRTIFIVAHRFSTIMDADKIIVLDKGRIVEIGPHSDLLQNNGFYSKLYFEQFKDKEEFTSHESISVNNSPVPS